LAFKSLVTSAMNLRRGILVPSLAVAFLHVAHWTFSSISLRRSQKRLNVRPWIGRENTPSPNKDNKAITREIRDLGRKGRFLQAKDAFLEAEVKDAILYSAIISAAATNGQFDEGTQLFEEMKDSKVELSDTVYSAMLKLLGQKGDYDAAVRIWKEMHELGLTKEGSTRQQSCFTGLMNAAAATGDVQTAQKEIDSAPYGVQLNAAHFGCLLKACRESADAEAAQKVILQMRDAGVERNIVHYTIYMGACARYVAKTQSKAEELEAQVRKQMEEDQVQANEYFLEEQVALNLQTASLRALQEEGASKPSEEALTRTGKLLESALDVPGMRLTRALRDLRDKYPKLRAAVENR